MLIPRFTLRWLFAVTTVVAVLALIASWAGQGVPWAVGVTAAVVALVAIMLLHAASFGFVWLYSQIRLPQTRPARARREERAAGE